MPDEVAKRMIGAEAARQLIVAKAVGAAEAVLNESFGELPPDPDIKSYLWYKTGAQLLMVGIQDIDRRVMNSDLGLTKLIPVEEAKPDFKVSHQPCDCGRAVIEQEECHNGFGDQIGGLVCSGCLNKPDYCKCKKLSQQYVPPPVS